MTVINFVREWWEWCKGKRTFAIGVLMIALGYLQDDQRMMLEGLGFITLRAGIKKVEDSL